MFATHHAPLQHNPFRSSAGSAENALLCLVVGGWRDSLPSRLGGGERIMMGRQIDQGALFYEVRLDERVPAGHLL